MHPEPRINIFSYRSIIVLVGFQLVFQIIGLSICNIILNLCKLASEMSLVIERPFLFHESRYLFESTNIPLIWGALMALSNLLHCKKSIKIGILCLGLILQAVIMFHIIVLIIWGMKDINVLIR